MKVKTLMNLLEDVGEDREVRIEIIDPHASDQHHTWLEPEAVVVEERDGERTVIIKADIN
jgi:hypothetical protein